MKILIVEDEVKIANLLRRNLEAEGCQVEVAHTGDNGLLFACEIDFDVILLDIMLPGINGFEITKALRAQSNNTPIIILTARDTEDDKKNSFAAGANSYMVKPVEFKTLFTQIKSLTSKKQTKEPRISSSPDNTINTAKLVTAVINTAIKKPTIINDSKAVKVKVVKKSLLNPQISTTPSITINMTEIENAIEVAALNKSIMDYAPMSIITINKDGYITSANEYFKNVSKTKKFKNHNVFTTEFFIRENLVEDYKKLLAYGTIVRRDHCYEKNSKGEDKYLKIIATPIYDSNGNIEGALSMALDNTEEVISKNNLVDLNNSLEQSIKERTAELNAANEELNKFLKLKSSFAADISHEIRTALTIIQGNLELLTRTNQISAVGLESADQILQEIKRISEMLGNLTSLTSTNSASQKLNYTKIDINKLIGDICNSLRVVANEKNISIEHKNNLPEIFIMADKTKLDDLFLNLVRNAIKYNKPNGWIKIRARKSGKNICINIDDNGIGIPQKHIPYIFERFYRVDSARTRDTGGSGLGLAICKWIAEIHGGNIVVSSKSGVGSTFSVCLPISLEHSGT